MPAPAILEALLFDLDGTIADTLPLIYEAFNDAFRPALGRRLSEREIRVHFGPPDHQMIASVVDREQLAPSIDRFLATYRARHAELVALFPGIEDLLADARSSGKRLGVVTGKSRVTALYTLEQLGVLPYFEAVLAGDDVDRPKPDPRALQLALGALGHSGATGAAMIGDSQADIRAGQAAGVTTIGVLWGNPDHDELLAAGPDFVCASVAELRQVLGL
jgi:phosphoglycolate phosphatase/pyrophosphatase PpaX